MWRVQSALSAEPSKLLLLLFLLFKAQSPLYSDQRAHTTLYSDKLTLYPDKLTLHITLYSDYIRALIILYSII